MTLSNAAQASARSRSSSACRRHPPGASGMSADSPEPRPITTTHFLARLPSASFANASWAPFGSSKRRVHLSQSRFRRL